MATPAFLTIARLADALGLSLDELHARAQQGTGPAGTVASLKPGLRRVAPGRLTGVLVPGREDGAPGRAPVVLASGVMRVGRSPGWLDLQFAMVFRVFRGYERVRR